MSAVVTFLFRIVDWLIPSAERLHSEETLRNARIVYSALLLVVLNALSFGVLGWAQGDRVLPWIVLASGGLISLTPIVHRLSRSLRFAAAWIGVVGTVLLLSTGALSGGMHSSAQLWFGALAVFILVTQGSLTAVLWTCGVGLCGMALWWSSAHGYALPDFEAPDSKAISWAIAFPAGLLLILSMLYGFFEAHRRAIENLDRQAKVLMHQAEELRQAKALAEAASKSRSDFIATVSHEIRTPMNGILGVTQLLQDTPLADDQRKYLQALRLSAEGLLSILGDILDFSKIEAGKLKIQPEGFPLRPVCEECLSVFAGIAAAKGVAMQLDIQPELPSHVYGDAVRIRQVLMNLIGNAVKFTDTGAIRLSVARADGDEKSAARIRFTITDTGIGMSEATQGSLFQPYSQADASSTRKYGGTGLGLAICHRLAGLMQGSVSFRSAVGSGSSFFFELPLPKAETPRTGAPAAPAAPAAADFRGKTVLLAEDNTVNQMVATKMLEKLGVKVEIARDGREAVARWAQGGLDIIFMDCQMPVMDGYEAARAIRARESEREGAREDGSGGPRIPMIALTAHAMKEDREKCLQCGMDEYLTKPVKSESLLLALQTWVK